MSGQYMLAWRFGNAAYRRYFVHHVEPCMPIADRYRSELAEVGPYFVDSSTYPLFLVMDRGA